MGGAPDRLGAEVEWASWPEVHAVGTWMSGAGLWDGREDGMGGGGIEEYIDCAVMGMTGGGWMDAKNGSDVLNTYQTKVSPRD